MTTVNARRKAREQGERAGAVIDVVRKWPETAAEELGIDHSTALPQNDIPLRDALTPAAFARTVIGARARAPARRHLDKQVHAAPGNVRDRQICNAQNATAPACR